jgi:hypothetical protein
VINAVFSQFSENVLCSPFSVLFSLFSFAKNLNLRDCKPASLRDFANWVQQVVREQIASLGYGKTGSSAQECLLNATVKMFLKVVGPERDLEPLGHK